MFAGQKRGTHMRNGLVTCLKTKKKIFTVFLRFKFTGYLSLITFESDYFQDLGVHPSQSCTNCCEMYTFKSLNGIKKFHYPQHVKPKLTCTFFENRLLLEAIITIPLTSFE